MLEFIFGSTIFVLLMGGVLGILGFAVGFAAYIIYHLAYGLLVCVGAAFLLLRSVVTGKPLPPPGE
jgi:hypothetical protein